MWRVGFLIFAAGCAHQAREERGILGAAQMLSTATPSGRAPAFPPDCRRWGKVALVALGTLRSVDLAAVRERYRVAFGLDIELLPAIPQEALDGAFNVGRNQYEAQPVVDVMTRALRLSPQSPPRWVIGVTDGDLYTARQDWRYAFSWRVDDVAVISTARLRQRDEDRALASIRALKLVTRVLAETYCGLERGGPSNSVLRPTMMSVDDLDELDESVWLPGPTRM